MSCKSEIKVGDLVLHMPTGVVGPVVRMYEVPNDRVPWEESYMRCVVQVGPGSRDTISTPLSSNFLVAVLDAEEMKGERL